MRTLVFDLETSDLRSDVGALLVVSFAELAPDGSVAEVRTQDINSIGRGTRDQREKKLALWAKDQITNADILIGHNSLAFDRHFLNGVLARHEVSAIPKRMHLDTMQIAKGKLAMGVSLDNLADILLKASKDRPSKHEWRQANLLDEESIQRLRQRCESDVTLTADLWNRIKPVYFEHYGR